MYKRTFVALCALFVSFFSFFVSDPYAVADVLENVSSSQEDSVAGGVVVVGDSGGEALFPSKEEIGDTPADRSPFVSEVRVLGDYDRSAAGLAFFDGITIALTGENLGDDNFLTPEGLYWSDKTRVEVIRGSVLGDYVFSPVINEKPVVPVTALSMNDGDSGRITHVGTTKSGIELDLIWTVTGSDKDEWEAYSGLFDSGVRGLAFTGEQFFPGASGNSIAVLYNRASNLGLHYQIVRHNTFEEIPVIVSFISTDIDSAQGVDTNLANLTELIPDDSNLVKQGNIIYDATPSVVNMNGSADLPRGGYLGAGFVSSFDYVFYSPAPQRVSDSYSYPVEVRYDLFGSALQARMVTQVNQHIEVNYVDTNGQELKPRESYRGIAGESYALKSLAIPRYKLVDIQKDTTNLNHPIVTFIYSPEHTVTLTFADETGRTLTPDRSYTILDGTSFTYTPPPIDSYRPPAQFSQTITRDTAHAFIYTKQPIVTAPTNAPPAPHSNTTGHVNTQLHNTAPLVSAQSHLSDSQPNDTNITTPTQAPNIHTETQSRDPFLVNTGMSAREKTEFLTYIKEIAHQAKEQYGNDTHKINHAIANTIAYPVYKNDMLQSMVNDFGNVPNVRNFDEMSDNLKSIHKEHKYIIDFPHLATTLASAEDSGSTKSLVKWLSGLSVSNLWGSSPDDNFLQLNSLTGDVLTSMDDKDYRTDIDSLIFHYHPDFKDLTLDEAITKYYSMDNLDLERQRLYKEVLQTHAGGKLNAKQQEMLNVAGAAATLGGLALIGITLFRRAKKELEKIHDNRKQYGQNLLNNVRGSAALMLKDPLQFLGNTILGPVANLLADSLALGGTIASALTQKIYSAVITPVTTAINKALIQSVTQNIINPISNNIVAPAFSFVEKNILVPVTKKVVKPAVRSLNRRIVQPVVNKIKPVAHVINRNVVKPAVKAVQSATTTVQRKVITPLYNKVVQPVVNKVIKPVTQPLITKVAKPVARTVHQKIVKPVANFVTKKIITPATNLVKRLWR